MLKSVKSSLFLLGICMLTPLFSMAASSITYELKMSQPQTHYFEVEVKVTGIDQDQTVLQLPVWAPGSYLVREFAGHVEGEQAFDGNQKALSFSKRDKSSWQIETKGVKELVFSYLVYAYELSVRTSFLDADHGYINGTSIFMYVEGEKDLPISLKIEPAKGWSKVSTALKQQGQVFEYVAEDYDELADSPIEIGNQVEFEFVAAGVPHRVAMFGQSNYDIPRLKEDMKKVVEAATAVFGDNPNEEYLFIVHNIENPGGGLEHKKSTTLQAERWQYGNERGYKRFLSLVAHEYFHLWNVKRIRPEALGPFDYQQENYTSLLWVAEGFTSYYDELLLLRAGIYSEKEYLKSLTSMMSRVENQPGSKIQPVADASFDAWIKGYRTNENSYNAQISYYSKGVLVAALLDMKIVAGSKGKYHLDDAMKALWKAYQKDGKGYTEADVQKVLEKYAKTNLDQFFVEIIHGTTNIDYAPYFEAMGLSLSDAVAKENNQPSLGLIMKEEAGKAKVRVVLRDQAAWIDGLNVHDEILAIDGVRVNYRDFAKAEGRLQVGEPADILIARDGLIKNIQVTPRAKNSHAFSLTAKEGMSKSHQKNKTKWLSK
ncbi:M61 family metallopeptidase [Persicobacter sp. CCB-QB2]|uniref:M61 family metallopeptidase n=1 Tax=Persicobacter sp. CCB-QB2 TaxID=1561025 RepID=UPI0009E2C402|nr:M61 family metallopeptidase [Persicobacter sp. CCB-QB2]